ncbi:FAD-dependent oxidoreductase, partial [Enterococcus casseliflavus]|uniref:FAD-dependent oxidoreductase n=1 Tax=Enterococcus casseliflavus TaxID=37734 RepID=UPI003D106E2D
ALGTWYPKGGISKVIDAMICLAAGLGVKFEFGSNVQKINVNGGRASGLTINGSAKLSDYIVAAADYHYIEQNLLTPSYQNYSKTYWE